MGGPRIAAVGPDGAPITVETERAPELAGDARVQAPEEAAATDTAIAASQRNDTLEGAALNAVDAKNAFDVASTSGALSTVGVPLERGALGIADHFGKRDTAREALKGLRDRHPFLSTAGEVGGAIAGTVALTESTGGLGGITKLPGLGGVAARMGVGGIENVVMATTKDLNESALGDKQANAEALVAAMPKHFLVGGLLTGAFEGGAHVLGKGLAAATRKAVPALEGAATRAVGRELGLEGDAALEGGQRVRGLMGGEVPHEPSAIAGVLEREQGVQRGRNLSAHAESADALAGAQQAEAAGMSLKHETLLERTAGAGRRGVAQAERGAAEGVLDAAAEGGAGVEAAELAGAGRRAGARGLHAETGERAGVAESALRGAEAGQEASVAEAIDAAQAGVAQVFERHGALRSQFSIERRAAQESIDAITQEQARVAGDLQGLIRRIGDGTESAARHGNEIPEGKISFNDFEDMLETSLGATGHGKNPDPAARWSLGRTLLEEYGADIHPTRGVREHLLQEYGYELPESAGLGQTALSRAEATGSEATNAEAQRLSALHDHLSTAREHAEEHLASVDQAIKATDDLAFRETQQASSRAAAEIERAQASVASNISTASKAHQKAQLALDASTESVKRVEAETASFVEAARGKGEGAVAKAEARGAKRIASAEADAARALEQFKASAAKERAGLAKTQDAQTSALPGPSQATDVDALAEGFGKYQASRGKGPLISNGGLWGAGMSLVHGNPVGAAGALGVSFAAGQARNVSNLTTARVLRGISRSISELDAAVRDGAKAVLTGSKIARSVASQSRGEKEPSFEELSKSIINAQGNPLELEHRVRESVGDLAGHAPGTYQEILATTQRAHAYLLSVLPEPQRDPYSLTPHLERGQVSETARYDFMSSARSIDDPLSLFEDVHSGDVTQAQVDAVAFVYPKLYDQMRNEVRRQSMYLVTPVDYMREVHVGTLLGQVTNQVLEPDFQKLMRDSYAEKEEKAQSQNAGSGGGGMNKSVESMKSGSENVEGGM